MAKFVSYDLRFGGLELADGGTGPLGDPLDERSAAIEITPEVFDRFEVSSTEIIIGASVWDIEVLWGGEGLGYNQSGDVYGLSGLLHSETFLQNGEVRYVLSEFDVAPADYFLYETWETIFSGNDQIYLSNQSDLVRAESGDDLVEAGRGFDTVYGGAGNDYIQGGYNGDQIYGDEGDDELRGGNGLDSVDGGEGNDVILGALGTDTLTGGAGNDVFKFTTALDGRINIDTITDYQVGVDQIQLSSSIFTAFANRVGQTVGLNQNLTYNQSTGALSYDADGSGGAPALEFAIIGTSSHPSLAADHFLIV